VALIVGVGLRLAEPGLEEESLLYGSSGQVLLRVTLRQATGAIGVAALWVTVYTAGEMTVTDLFRVRTFAEEIYAANAATGDLQAAALELLPSIAVAATLIMCGLILSVHLMYRHGPPVLHIQRVFRLGRWRWPAAVLVWSVAAILFAVPLFSLFYQAGLQVSLDDGESPVIQWRTGKLLEMVFVQSWGQFGAEFTTSLILGVLTSLVTLSAAIVLARIARSGRRAAALVCVIVALLLSLPGPLLGVIAIQLLGRLPAVYDSLAAPGLAITLRALPVATLIMWYALRTVPDDLLETARIHGASGVTELLVVCLPACWPAVVIGLLVVFVITLGDLAASQIVLVAGHETLANRVFDRLHSGAQDQVCGLFLAMLLLLAVVTVAIVCLWKYWRNRTLLRAKPF
jgi:ABC-type Fe3+ transport system permease subunit